MTQPEKSSFNLVEELKSHQKMVGVWGLGYIGFSSMAYFAKNGIVCLGTDVDETRVKAANLGRTTIPNLDYWLAFDTEQLARNGLMRATHNWQDLLSNSYPVHIIAIPTEKGGRPYHGFLKDVLEKLGGFSQVKTDYAPLIIIESTIAPNLVDNLVTPLLQSRGLCVGDDILVGVAPRRDWFTDKSMTLKTLPRVMGGTTPQTTELMSAIIGLVCDCVLKAKDHRHAAMVKSVENAYRQLDITLANQLSLAYPDVDMVEVLRLAGTKWNMQTYHPSFGTGGYCIPVAPRYVLEGATQPEELSLLKTSLESDQRQPARIVEALVKRGVKKVGILGLAYRGDLKVHTLSPTVSLLKHLKQAKIEVKVQDPYYSAEEIRELVDTDTFEFTQGLVEFDTVLVVCEHMQYAYTSPTEIRAALANCRLVLDNTGVWEQITLGDNTEYHRAGAPHWLG